MTDFNYWIAALITVSTIWLTWQVNEAANYINVLAGDRQMIIMDAIAISCTND